MLTDSEKRAIFQAVSRLVTDRDKVKQAFFAALKTNSYTNRKDLLTALVQQRLLTPSQAIRVQSQLSTAKTTAAAKPKGQLDQDSAPTLLALKSPGQSDHDSDDGTDLKITRLGNYRILQKLGQGGMCTVFLCCRDDSDQKYAIKVLPRKLAANQVHLDRFYREAKSGALLQHPNIVRNLEFGQNQATGHHYLVMEYIDGPSAQYLLQSKQRLSVGDAVHIIIDIARGLEYAHSRNIIHRDIKPDNILLTRTGVAKLADLGLAKRTDEASHLTAARQGFGTPYYMPYEQAVNARATDGRSDIYALGATFYHLLTGQVPFPGDSHLEIVEKKRLGHFIPASARNPEVPPVLEKIIATMMATNPKDRYQTISEVIIDLEKSKLAPEVPSFVDAALAYQDPVILERLASVAQPTRAERLNLDGHAAVQEVADDVWYLRYKLQNNKWCKAKTSTTQIIKRIQERKLPAGVQASKTVEGEFLPLHELPEFEAYFRRRRTKSANAKTKNGQAKKPTPTQAPVTDQNWFERWRAGLRQWWKKA